VRAGEGCGADGSQTLWVDAGEKVDFLAGVLLLGVLSRLRFAGLSVFAASRLAAT
jgi:hypothetical protein